MYGFGRECRPLFWTTAVTTSLFGSGRASSSILHHRHTGPSSTASVQFRVQKSSAMSPCRRDAGSSFGSLCWTAAGRPHAYSDTSSRTTAPVLSVRKQRRPLITSPFPASSAERFGFACSAPLGSITWRRRARTPSSAGGCQTESVSTRLFVKGLTPSSPWSFGRFGLRGMQGSSTPRRRCLRIWLAAFRMKLANGSWQVSLASRISCTSFVLRLLCLGWRVLLFLVSCNLF
jgi:hypothetical protein